MKITNFLALGICLLFGSCTMQKSTVQPVGGINLVHT